MYKESCMLMPQRAAGWELEREGQEGRLCLLIELRTFWIHCLNPEGLWLYVYEYKTISQNCFNIGYFGEAFSRVNSITVISFHDHFPMEQCWNKVPFSWCHFYFAETPCVKISYFFFSRTTRTRWSKSLGLVFLFPNFRFSWVALSLGLDPHSANPG